MWKNVALSIVVLALFSGPAYAQLSKEYSEWIKKAHAFYDSGQYQQSAVAFTRAFASSDGKGIISDKYDAACSWAQAGNKDSAFSMLTRIATKGNFTNLSHMLVDADLASLHSDPRWENVCAIVKQNKDKAGAGLDKKLVAQLDTILQDDQGDRMKLTEIDKKNGPHSPESKDLWKIISAKDSINIIKVTGILDKRGWLGPDVVGREGNMTLFLVIQHADIKTQEKYLPMMREAVKNNKAQAASLALLEDRVALGEGKKQIYGSQIGSFPNGSYYVDELEDPQHVDIRRAEVGLGPLADYVQYWNIKWDVADYEKQLPEIQKMRKELK